MEDYKVKYETLTGDTITSDWLTKTKSIKLFNQIKDDVEYVELIYSPSDIDNAEVYDENWDWEDDGEMVIKEQTNKVVDLFGRKFISQRNI